MRNSRAWALAGRFSCETLVIGYDARLGGRPCGLPCTNRRTDIAGRDLHAAAHTRRASRYSGDLAGSQCRSLGPRGRHGQVGRPDRARVGGRRGGTIPYQPQALAKKKENFAKRAELGGWVGDPEAKCLVGGVPRMTYMGPFQIIQQADKVTFLYQVQKVPSPGLHERESTS